MTLRSYQTISIEKLRCFERNSRKHSEKQIKQVSESIKEFGFTSPLLIDENNMILAGHCRLEAAKLLGLLEVPCILLNDLTNLQKRAYVIADNKLTLNADWDFDILKAEFVSLDELGFNTDLTGFDPEEISALFMPPEAFGEDELPSEFGGSCHSGETWLLGEHKLICGLNNVNECDIIIQNFEKHTGKKAIREN